MATLVVSLGNVNARPMRYVGESLVLIRTKPAAATIDGGDGLILGRMDQKAVGIYELSWQEATNATAAPLGTKLYAIFEIFENTAGVFLVKKRIAEDIEGGSATSDADDVTTLTDTDSTDIDITGDLATDAKLEFAVATSTGVTNGATILPGIAVGDLVLWNGLNTNFTVFALRRIA